jgi:hypothetical protein
MNSYFFPYDKNYILKEAQLKSKELLLNDTVLITRDIFEKLENPMGLVDDFMLELRNENVFDLQSLDKFYELASVIYRFKFGNNQLSFIWDGSSHFEQYQKEWTEKYHQWVFEFAQSKTFRRIILKSCILEKGQNHSMLTGHLNRFLLSKYNLKVNKNQQLKKAA